METLCCQKYKDLIAKSDKSKSDKSAIEKFNNFSTQSPYYDGLKYKVQSNDVKPYQWKTLYITYNTNQY